MSTYASFQGRVFLGKRDIAGLPIEVRSPGNVAVSSPGRVVSGRADDGSAASRPVVPGGGGTL